MGNPDLGWLDATEPRPGTSYPSDSRELVGYLARAQDAIAGLPPRRQRDPGQQRLAAGVHVAARRARRRFLEAHAGRLYAELTDGGAVHLRLPELADQAAEVLPGLVPGKELMEQERGLPQVDKEGWETDQAILLWGLLRDPVAGGHVAEAMRRPTPQAQAALAAFRATGRANLGVVRVDRDGDLGIVTVDNAAVLNAEDDPLVAALEVAVDLVLLDDAIRVGVVRGAPMTHPRYAGRRVFSAGINLTALYRGEISLIGFFLSRELGYINKIFRGLSRPESPDDWLAEPIEKPWIAAVDTFAIGGGAQLLLVFDRVVATEDAYFSLPALREGIIPGAANLRLPRVAGNRLSRQFIFADRRVDAASEQGQLLFDELVPSAAMESAVQAAAESLTQPAVINNRRIQHRFEEPPEVFRAYLANYAIEQVRRLYSADLVANLERTWIRRNR